MEFAIVYQDFKALTVKRHVLIIAPLEVHVLTAFAHAIKVSMEMIAH